MIEFSIDPKYYKEIHNVLSSVLDKCRLEFSNSGIISNSVNVYNTVLVSIRVPTFVFEEYTISKTVKIGYILNLFEDYKNEKSLMTQFLNSKTLHSFVFQEKNGVVKIIHDIFTSVFDLPDIKSIRNEPKIPAMNLNCVIDLPVELLKKIISRDQYIIFDVKDGFLTCFNPSQTLTTTPIEVNSNEVSNAQYDSEILNKIVKSIPKSIKDIKMSFATDCPCKIEFNICDGKVPVIFLLAPRIDH